MSKGRGLDEKDLTGKKRPGTPAEARGDTAAEVLDTLDGKTAPTLKRRKSYEESLKDYLKGLEGKETKSSVEKARKIRMALMFVGKYYKVDTENVKVKRLPGSQVGEAKETHTEIDPVLFNGKDKTEDDFTLLRHVLLHELTHLEKNIDNEGLTELFATDASRDKIRDYEDLVSNVNQVTSVLADGNREAGIARAVDLYSEGKYDELYKEFEAAYAGKYPAKVARNSGVALKIFQLAFPELHVAGEGKLVEDQTAIDEAYSKDYEPGI